MLALLTHGGGEKKTVLATLAPTRSRTEEEEDAEWEEFVTVAM